MLVSFIDLLMILCLFVLTTFSSSSKTPSLSVFIYLSLSLFRAGFAGLVVSKLFATRQLICYRLLRSVNLQSVGGRKYPDPVSYRFSQLVTWKRRRHFFMLYGTSDVQRRHLQSIPAFGLQYSTTDSICLPPSPPRPLLKGMHVGKHGIPRRSTRTKLTTRPPIRVYVTEARAAAVSPLQRRKGRARSLQVAAAAAMRFAERALR